MGSPSSAECTLDVAGAVGREVVVPLAAALGGHGEKQSGGHPKPDIKKSQITIDTRRSSARS